MSERAQESSTAARLKATLDVARALISTRDLDTLLQMILREASRVVDADRGTLFLVDQATGDLRGKIAQGLDAGGEIRISRGKGIAGHVALTGESISLRDAYTDARFNQSVDLATGYRTRNLLAVPMRDMQGSIVGVLQVLNKHDGDFTDEDTDILVALGSQAAAAIENAMLHEDIQRLFEGFVKASAVAIESRDPSTAGHSGRVAKLTLGLADALEMHGAGPWTGARFSSAQRMEIRYAALLHDFGKVGVREDVLVKANKLYPMQLTLVRQRFDYAKKSLEADMLRTCVNLLLSGATPQAVRREEQVFAQQAAQLDAHFDFVLRCNRPTVLAAGSFDSLQQVQNVMFQGPDGLMQPLLSADETRLLSIPKGSLSHEERSEIESHVSHTFRFLSQIPWTKDLRRVPEIAHGHHEKLNGNGYPRALSADMIGVEARMMAIADIYDALTANDRPYKKAIPHSIALRILTDEANAGQLDGHLLDVFVGARVPNAVYGDAFVATSEQRSPSGIFSADSAATPPKS